MVRQVRIELARTQASRKPRSYEPERTCSAVGCTTRLSKYNPGDFCNAHRPRKRARLRGWEAPDKLRRCQVCAARIRGRADEVIEVEVDGMIHREGTDGRATMCEGSATSARKRAS